MFMVAVTVLSLAFVSLIEKRGALMVLLWVGVLMLAAFIAPRNLSHSRLWVVLAVELAIGWSALLVWSIWSARWGHVWFLGGAPLVVLVVAKLLERKGESRRLGFRRKGDSST